MTIFKKGTKLYTFDKSQYSQTGIEEEYNQKLRSLLRGRRSNELTEKEREEYNQIVESFMRDPRQPNMVYMTEEASLKAKQKADELEVKAQMKYIFFFHNSDRYILLFRAQGKPENKKSLVRPSFYWFSDRHHHQIPGFIDNYLYLFCKNPKEEAISFRSRHEGYGFHGLYDYYTKYLKLRSEAYSRGDYDKYIEPSILMSFSDIVPDLIAKYNEATGCHTIDRPLIHQGVKFRLLGDNGVPRAFNEIEEIVSAVPHINNSLPFVEPERVDRIYTYEGFNKFATERDGTWL